MINKEIYLNIYKFFLMELMQPHINNDLELIDKYFIKIFRRSDWDIEVSHYLDEDAEEELDWWWWVIDMEDEIMYDDMENELESIDIESLQKYLKDKTDFAYELCFTW